MNDDDRTIRVDAETYESLERARHEGESLGQTIKRAFAPSPLAPRPKIDLDAWFAAMDRLGPFGDDFVKAVEQQIRDRRAPVNRKRSRA